MAQAPPPALHLSGVERSFPIALGLRRRRALAGIDLELEPGRTLGLVGPNGSGKSTLLRIVAGVDRPSRGTVRVFGADPQRASVRARLAYLPEDTPFPGELTANGVMQLLGSLHGLSRARIRERAGVLLERVGLGREARTPLKRYSRGMLRRFGLAQAFLTEPELVLLDEPTAGLDALGFEVVAELLGEARARGTTIAIASHVAADALEHCDRLALLLGGALVRQGTPLELLGVEGRVELAVEGLDEAQLEELERWITEQGGRLVARRAGTGTLLELYRASGARAR